MYHKIIIYKNELDNNEFYRLISEVIKDKKCKLKVKNKKAIVKIKNSK